MIRVKLFRVVFQDLFRGKRSFILSGIGIAVGIASLSFFLALGQGVKKLILGKIFPADQIEVIPPSSDFGSIMNIFGASGRRIDEEYVKAIRKIEGVKQVYPKMKFAFPARAWGGRYLLKRDIYTEVIADGIDPKLIEKEIPKQMEFKDLKDKASLRKCHTDRDCPKSEYCQSLQDGKRCNLPVPAVVSKYLLELYNKSIAPQNRLPQMSEKLILNFARGFTFNVELGRSFLGRRAPKGIPRRIRVKLVGFSDKAIDIGFTIPLEYVKRFNQEYAGKEAANTYSSVIVKVKDKADLTHVSTKIRQTLGLEIKETAEKKIGRIITILTLVLTLISIMIIIIAAINVSHTFYMIVSERKREIGILRAIGASKNDIRNIVLMEAGIIGFISGLFGLFMALGGAKICDLISQYYIPEFPFKPKTYFDFSWLLCIGCLSFAFLFSEVGAYFPARHAAKIDPATALTIE
jgi:ABC-type lipoprotein release transport system permease subunit